MLNFQIRILKTKIFITAEVVIYQAASSHKQAVSDLFAFNMLTFAWQDLSKTPSRHVLLTCHNTKTNIAKHIVMLLWGCTRVHIWTMHRETNGHIYTGIRVEELHKVQPPARLALAEGLSSYDTTIPWKLPFAGTLAWPFLLLPSQGYQGWQHGWCTLGGLQSAVNHQDHKGTGSTHSYIKAHYDSLSALQFKFFFKSLDPRAHVHIPKTLLRFCFHRCVKTLKAYDVTT